MFLHVVFYSKQQSQKKVLKYTTAFILRSFNMYFEIGIANQINIQIHTVVLESVWTL